MKRANCLVISVFAFLVACGGGGNSTPATPSGSGGGTTQSDASVCLNAGLFTLGSVLHMVQKTSYSTGGSITTTTDLTTQGTVTFNSATTHHATGTVTSIYQGIPGNNTTATVDVFAEAFADTKRILRYGQVSNASGIQLTETFQPYAVDNFGMQIGAAISQSYSVVSTLVSTSGTTTTNKNYSDTTKFVGMETITVPAGSFNACKFEETLSVTQNNLTSTTTSTNWVAANKGLPLRTVAVSDGITTTEELQSATLNGVAVTGN